MIYDDRLIANRQPFPVVQLVQQGRARRKRTGKKKSKKRVKTGAMAREHIFLKKDLFRNPVLSARYRNDRRGAKHRKLLPSLFFAAWKWLKKSASADETHIPGRVLSTWTSHFCSHWSYPLGIHANTPTVVQGGGGGGGVMEPGGIGGTPPRSFWCCSISKRLCLQWKAFDLLNKMRYILRVLVLLEPCDVTNSGRQLGRHLGFYK